MCWSHIHISIFCILWDNRRDTLEVHKTYILKSLHFKWSHHFCQFPPYFNKRKFIEFEFEETQKFDTLFCISLEPSKRTRRRCLLKLLFKATGETLKMTILSKKIGQLLKYINKTLDIDQIREDEVTEENLFFEGNLKVTYDVIKIIGLFPLNYVN